jgi:hypothetical protein
MEAAFARFDAFPHASLAAWQPRFPPGRIERIYLHWSAGDYETVYPAYHYCIALHDGVPIVVETHDLRANMRDAFASDASYAQHTYRRNANAAGLSIMGMRDARPQDFGAFPLVQSTVEALGVVAAAIARAYAISIDAAHVLTHAEAAIVDGYFGAEGDEQRWDIARLRPSPDLLTEGEAHFTGDYLRALIAAAL